MDTKEKKEFSVQARMRSSDHAMRGIEILFRGHNAVSYILFVVVLGYFGYFFQISNIEWVALVIVIAIVFVAEAINTAIEIDIDLTSPEYHPFARDTKDVAAGAVLLAIMFASIVGAIIFIPKIIELLLVVLGK